MKPDCGVDELKRAYRRRVSRLHPDRHGSGNPNIKAAELLKELTAQYGSAMDFERRYGRLPGAAATARAAVVEVPVSTRPVPEAPVVAARHSRRKMLILMLGSCALLWAIVSPLRTPKVAATLDTTKAESDPVDSMTVPSSNPSGRLRLGMSSARVRDIEGDPLVVHDDLWEYGPSWISFHSDRVVDWYSSPLHSLRTVDGRPPGASR